MIRILVVDDEESIRETFGVFLANAGYEARSVSSYESAVQALEEDEYQLVFTDILLKDKSGMDLVKWLGDRNQDVLAVLVTGQPSLETATESVRLGAYDYLAKPVTKDILLKTVKKALEHRELLLKKRALEQENYRYRYHLEELIRERTMELEEINRQLLKEIQERKEAERALQENKEKLQSIIENVNDMLFTVDAKTLQVTYVSPNVERIFGYLPEELIGRRLDEFPEIEQGGQLEEILGDIFTNLSGKHEDEMRVARKDGGFIWLRGNLSLSRDAGGNPLVIHGVSRDITERKEAELKLHRILECVNDIVFSVDKKTSKFIYVSPNVERLLGYSQSQVVGSDYLRFIHPEDSQSVREFYETILNSRESNFEIETRLITGSGEYIWLLLRISTWRNEAGEVEEVYGAATDITRRKKAETLLRSSHQGLEGEVKECTRVLMEAYQKLEAEISKRIVAEKKLMASEKRFRTIFDKCIEGVSIHRVDPETNLRELVDCNRSYIAFSGRDRDELFANARNIDQWRANESVTVASDEIINCIKKKHPFSGVFTWLRPDGKGKLMEFQTVPVTEGEETYIYVIDRVATRK